MGKLEQVSHGVHRLRTLIVNVYFVRSGDEWVLVDAGMPGTTGAIRKAATQLFGARRPRAILLTHGHFDHVGALPRLADQWGVPIFVHRVEVPYVTGRSAYAPPDPSVGGGLLARLSFLFPRGPYDFGARVHALPVDRTVPGLPDWRWVHTPGHTAGHVSFFRDADRTLIAGDALVTTRQESLLCVLFQIRRLWRPPAYFTPDWDAAERSIRRLADLDPEYLATGHGRTLSGEKMKRAFRRFAENAPRCRPTSGRYVERPAVADDRGIVSVPPRSRPVLAWRALGLLAAGAAGVWFARGRRTVRS